MNPTTLITVYKPGSPAANAAALAAWEGFLRRWNGATGDEGYRGDAIDAAYMPRVVREDIERRRADPTLRESVAARMSVPRGAEYETAVLMAIGWMEVLLSLSFQGRWPLGAESVSYQREILLCVDCQHGRTCREHFSCWQMVEEYRSGRRDARIEAEEPMA